jgi:hypothetical protein
VGVIPTIPKGSRADQIGISDPPNSRVLSYFHRSDAKDYLANGRTVCKSSSAKPRHGDWNKVGLEAVIIQEIHLMLFCYNA